MDTGDQAESNSSNSPGTGRHGRKWKTIERLLGALAALIAVIGGGVWAVKTITKDSAVEEEQKLVQQLRPGHTLDRAIEIMDDKPHFTKRLASGNRVYQYNRTWERIQLLVDPENITVLSVGIYADKTEFRPSFSFGPLRLTINRTPYQEAFGDPMFGYCGAHSGSYFEYRESLPDFAGGGSVAVGIHDSRRGNTSMRPVCAGLGKAPDDCVLPSEFQEADASTPDHTACLTSPPAGDFRKSTPIAALVITKQLGMTEDMFQSPYEVSFGND
ncbi:hypothetical protein [Streptomyces sp. YS415]|uniref:hypothetical protein n=1 Tax=Streptomyces sp. YS415 TaxID=2944806 RepID=UPI0020212500|nr:hypothetical protein [Streptomyces sp. YS415]MCL7430359.1 hypothetical protein [Streptomyces sp. YS415]